MNIDYLLLRIKEQGIHADVLDAIPWKIWYIWKARNEKIFSNKDVLPLETIQFAVKEAKSWILAQRIPELVEDPMEEELHNRRTASATHKLSSTVELSNRRIMDKQTRESRPGFCGYECR